MCGFAQLPVTTSSCAAVGVSCTGSFDVAMNESHIMAALLTDLPAAAAHVRKGRGGSDCYDWGTYCTSSLSEEI